MTAKSVLLLLGLAVTSVAAVPLGDTKLSIGAVLEKFEKAEHEFPSIVHPSKEEWIRIATEAHHGASIPTGPSFNYYFEANETGRFETTDGVAGLYNTSSYVVVFDVNNEANQFGYDIVRYTSEQVGDTVITATTQKYVMFTPINASIFAVAGAESGAAYAYENETFTPVLEIIKFFQGSVAVFNDTIYFEKIGMEFLNETNHYSLSECGADGQIDVGRSSAALVESFARNSVPLSPSLGKQVFSHKDPVAVAQILRDIGVSSSGITITEGVFEGQISLGRNGTYEGSSSSATEPFPIGKFVNSSAAVYGYYKVVNETSSVTPFSIPYTLSQVFTARFF